MTFRLRIAVIVSVLAPLASCGDDVCGDCDGATEYCEVQEATGFLQNGGNPNVFGSPATWSCHPLPERCFDDVDCACLTCEGLTTDEPIELGDCGLVEICDDVEGAIQVSSYTM